MNKLFMNWIQHLKMGGGIVLSLLIVILVVIEPNKLMVAEAATHGANENQVYQYLINNMGLNKAVASGILANIAAESNFNPEALGDNGTSYGICQWHNSRWTNLVNYCNSNGYDSSTINGQMHFLEYELKNRGLYNELKAMPNTVDGAYRAAYRWCVAYEVPADTKNTAHKRARSALWNYYTYYQSVTGAVIYSEYYDDVTNNSATVYSCVMKSTSVTVTECGLYIGTSESNMKQVKSEAVTSSVSSNTNGGLGFRIWYESSEYSDKYKLSQGTTYYYKFYIVANGKYEYSEVNSFKTTGTSACTDPNHPFDCCGCTTTYAGCYVVNSSSGLDYNSAHNFSSSAGELANGTVVYIAKSNTPCKTSGGQGHVIINGKTYCIAMNLLREATDSEHPWDNGKVTKAATCVATGVKTYTCSGCGKTRTETIPKLTTHTLDNGTVTTKATCAAAGVKTYKCTVSGCSYSKTETIVKDASNHTSWNSGVVTKAATCTETGIKTYTCNGCSATRTETIEKDASNHTIWNSGVVTKAATCAATGEKTYTCNGCSATKSEIIPVVSQHTWDNGVVVKEPTYEAVGTRRYTCRVCQMTKDETILPLEMPVEHIGDQISLNGRIEYNYFLSITDSFVGKPNAYVQFSGVGVNQKCYDYEVVTKGGQTAYMYTLELNASQMANIITVEYIADGITYIEDNISVVDYANIIIANENNNPEYAEAKELVTAMLNYGGYAQQYFGVNTSSLVNSGLYTGTNIDPVTDVVAFSDATRGMVGIDSIPSNSELKFVGASLVCESVTEMKFYYEMTKPVSASEAKNIYKVVAIGNSNVNLNVDGKYLVVTAGNITAANLNSIMTISISRKDNGMASLTYMVSPVSYMVEANRSYESNTKIACLMRAMYYYNQAAKNYNYK